MTFCSDPNGYHNHDCPAIILERIALALEALVDARPEPEHATKRIIGYTVYECERDMVNLYNSHCANPEEHTE